MLVLYLFFISTPTSFSGSELKARIDKFIVQRREELKAKEAEARMDLS